MGAAAPAAAAARWPTPATHCFICPPHTQGWNCHAAAGAQAAFAPTPSAVGQCGPQAAAMMPTPATHCFICPPHTQSWNCYPEARVPTLTLACAPDPRLFTLGCASVVCQPLHPPTPQLERARTSWFDCYTREVCHTPPTPELQRFAPTLRTSWMECHTQMAGCTVHVCFQGQQGVPVAAPAAMTGATLCLTVGGAAITRAVRPRPLSARLRAAEYSIHSADRRGSAWCRSLLSYQLCTCRAAWSTSTLTAMLSVPPPRRAPRTGAAPR